ncbi:DUF2828 family protein [Ethanoligenens harbinense]|uniref:DUF2828 domain-containing protein n=1 Tax=Ethanoligenens harbinense (strain DSM 18485 / JCM 12961 / CGMCC 1.5033 / YUAN-3) TaxID=663278 RepID=E6U5P3_ETHHY|nr:DUF2828 family protein [Ethanoligenens harbinense]ADU26802.1 hypothetical protein Ethha_1258 [Ethanoligenens harbinense YUAN-3]AVQ97390.1 DUF2828 domain-containing protein [Ethanoligenens harbinense YUAN-3]AYF40046.1 DUF2828 domain-containing protein [Ethanoligenens harbinense]AYF42879.1 DUF2828 domain-containing protein [Ethanoligenens harbinense]QCN93642.1 DUF2828 family protein [Ethanoligenens harbinense]
MLNFLKKQANTALTENGAATYATTSSDCLDLFATIGALRNEPDEEVIKRFARAYAENADLAVKTLFFARDIRGGLGERKVFRLILRHMANDMPASVLKNLWAVPEYGRYDDLLVLLDSPLRQDVISYIKTQLDSDIRAFDGDGTVSLLGKWLPSVNAHSAEAVRCGKLLAKALGMTEADYRRTLTKLRAKIKLIENNLRKKDYTFDYERQPSKAMMKYRKAFLRNDGERYKEFLSRVANGKATLHTGTLYPYDIIRPILSGSMTDGERKSMDATWNALEDFTNGENALAVIDGSGSMYSCGDPKPAEVALSLGIYFAEHGRGGFAGHFITFSENPRLVEIKGRDIFEKVKYCMSFNEIANTNIQKVFDLILRTAVKNRLPQSELPATLYIISDMEFDFCTTNAEISNFTYAKKAYAAHGYRLPTVVFWNVQSRNEQQPVTSNEQGVLLVSGASPRVFSMIESGNMSPMSFMLDALNNERYTGIKA